MTLPVSVANGSIDGGATTLGIPAGAVESGTLTVTRTAGTTAAVTADIGLEPVVPDSFQGNGQNHGIHRVALHLKEFQRRKPLEHAVRGRVVNWLPLNWSRYSEDSPSNTSAVRPADVNWFR